MFCLVNHTKLTTTYMTNVIPEWFLKGQIKKESNEKKVKKVSARAVYITPSTRS